MDKFSYALGKPAIRATLKQEFADFRVNERLGFEPTGAGQHVWVQLRKTDLSTTDAARLLARQTQSDFQTVGYSGMKDRRGECSQWFSLPAADGLEDKLSQMQHSAAVVLQIARNDRKLKIGTHAANRFSLRLRRCEGSIAEFEKRLEAISREGVPNYFGSQRFGRNMSNIAQVTELMAAAVELEQGQVSPLKKLGRVKRGMLLSAARAYVFNHLLSVRIDRGNWNQYVVGDVLSLDGTARFFAIKDKALWDEVLERRLHEFDIHPTGLLTGAKDSADRYVSWGKAADIESRVLDQFPLLAEGLVDFGVAASRRSLRFLPTDLAWRWEESEANLPDLLLDFELPKGAYATSLLRELCLTE
jgi:tRNA pseudouridine13 synthase